MKKRKERSEIENETELGNVDELRTIVADAKAAAAQEEIEVRLRTTSIGKTAASKPPHRPKSSTAPETKPRSSSATQRKVSGQSSFDSSEFIPPPPMLEVEDPTRNDKERNQKVRDT